jgi:uracil-DNA glycosylase
VPSTSGKSRRRSVPALFPNRGLVDVLLVGEAPGARGAARSRIPFWGDRAGRLLYRTLQLAGMAEVPEQAWTNWDGEALARLDLKPRVFRAALTNALPFLPAHGGPSGRAPSRADLLARPNRLRLKREVVRAAKRSETGRVRVIALGRKAEMVLKAIRKDLPSFALHYVPHPSPQALAAGRPGTSMRLRERQWTNGLLRLLTHRPP